MRYTVRYEEEKLMRLHTTAWHGRPRSEEPNYPPICMIRILWGLILGYMDLKTDTRSNDIVHVCVLTGKNGSNRTRFMKAIQYSGLTKKGATSGETRDIKISKRSSQGSTKPVSLGFFKLQQCMNSTGKPLAYRVPSAYPRRPGVECTGT